MPQCLEVVLLYTMIHMAVSNGYVSIQPRAWQAQTLDCSKILGEADY
jgi:hypothetical protein